MNVSELIERLRRLTRSLFGEQGVGPIALASLAFDASEALEAQAREIERLLNVEAQRDAAERVWRDEIAEHDKTRSRLAAAERGWERECADGDAVLCALCVDPQDYRTDGGSLNLPKIRDRLRAEKAAIALMRKAEATLLGETNEALSACQSEGQGWKGLALNQACQIEALRKDAERYHRVMRVIRALCAANTPELLADLDAAMGEKP